MSISSGRGAECTNLVKEGRLLIYCAISVSLLRLSISWLLLLISLLIAAVARLLLLLTVSRFLRLRKAILRLLRLRVVDLTITR